MVGVGVACVVFCFLYTTLLSYHGLGDVLVLLFFGIVPVCCTYYVIMPSALQAISGEIFLGSLACGMVVDTLLVVNNFRDRDNDRAAGKKTLIVRLTDRWGDYSALWLYLLLGCVPVLFMLGAVIYDAITMDTDYFLLPLLALYIFAHHQTYQQMKYIYSGKELNEVLGNTARNIFIYGILSFIIIAGSITLVSIM